MMVRISEAERLEQMTQIERIYWNKGILPAGMDEVGRGPLAGPVMAACVILPPSPLIDFVNDSKLLSEAKREKLYPIIMEQAIAAGIGFVDVAKIDELGIVPATKLAFERAYMCMSHPCSHVITDAVKNLNISAHQKSVIHGDSLSYLIAAASIVAKVERDRFMVRLDKRYPEYGFARNKGYGTREHIAALKKYGPCPEHRISFVRDIMNDE